MAYLRLVFLPPPSLKHSTFDVAKGGDTFIDISRELGAFWTCILNILGMVIFDIGYFVIFF